MTNTYYLAHPLLSRKEIQGWQLKTQQEHNINFLNPFYDTTGPERDNITRLDAGNKPVFPKGFEIALVQKDIISILETDGVVAIVDGNVSYGTIQEVVYARLFNKPVYSIITNDKHNHPWLLFHSTYIFKSFEEFEEFMVNNLVSTDTIINNGNTIHNLCKEEQNVNNTKSIQS